MPNDYYLMDENKAKKAGGAEESTGPTDQDIDDLADDFFDFIVLDKDAIESQMGGKGKSKKDQ